MLFGLFGVGSGVSERNLYGGGIDKLYTFLLKGKYRTCDFPLPLFLFFFFFLLFSSSGFQRRLRTKPREGKARRALTEVPGFRGAPAVSLHPR